MSRKGVSNAKTNKSQPIVYPPNCAEIKDNLSKDELVKRLKHLYVKFQEFEQDDPNNEKYKPLASFLASRTFFDNSDREVRMYSACILADAMRIFAPNAPFSKSQLKDVLRFFVKQLSDLQLVVSPIFRQAFYLLDVIASTQVFCAYVEFEDECPSFFCEVFECLLNAVRKEHASNVKNFIAEMCLTLLQESPVITNEILDCLLSRLTEPSKSGNPAAFKLVLDIILKAKEALEPSMMEFFRTTMLSGPSSDSSISKDAYAILFELSVGCPDVVHTVLSTFLREALELPQEPLRLAAVRFAGQLYSRQSGVGALFVTKYSTLWAAYLGRSKDASLTIRTNWIKQSVPILTALTMSSEDEKDIAKSIFDRLITRATDVDAQVRLAVIDAVVTLTQFDFSRIPDDLLRKIEELTRDKHARTRSSAVLALGRIYRRVCVPLPTDKKAMSGASTTKSSELEVGDNDDNLMSDGNAPAVVFSAEQKNRVCWIRNKILHLYASSSLLEDRALVERVLYACLVPVTSLDLNRRLQELVSLYSSLDDNAISCFDQLIRSQSQLREMIHRWSSSAVCVHDGSGMPSQGSHLAMLSRMLPADSCPQDSMAHLDRMLISNKQFAEKLKAASDFRCSSTKASDLAVDIVKIVSTESKKFESQKSSTLLTTVKFILERTLPLLISGPSLIGLLRLVFNLNAGQVLSHSEVTSDAIVPTLRLCMLVSSVFKTGCQQVDPVLITETTDSDHFKAVLDQFVSLFDTLASPEALAFVARTLPFIINSPSSFQNQSPQFYLTIQALQRTLGHLALRSHTSLAKQATKCLVHVLAPSEYIRVVSPIVDTRIVQVKTALKKIASFEDGKNSSTAECTPDDSEKTPTIESEVSPGVVAYYALARVVTYLPKSFFNDMKILVATTHEWLNSTVGRGGYFHPSIRIAGLKFLARWLASLRPEQPIESVLVKRIGECIAAHVRILSNIRDVTAEANKDAVAIGLAAVSSSFRLLRSPEPIFMSLPSVCVVSLALLMASMDAKALRSSYRNQLVKIQRFFLNHTLPAITLAILACTFISSDKDVRVTMRQVIDKLISGWRLQAQHQSTLAEASDSSESRVLPLYNLPDSHLPCLITLLSFIATNNITQLEACRSALNIIFELITSRGGAGEAALALRASSEHLPLCRGLVNKLKSLTSSVSSTYSPPEFTSSWSENSLSAMINVALAEIPTEKGRVPEEEFAVEIDSKQFLAVMGPLCELFQGDPATVRPRQAAPPVPIGVAPLSESGKATPVLHSHHLNEATESAGKVATKLATAEPAIETTKSDDDDDDGGVEVKKEEETVKSKAKRGRKRKGAVESPEKESAGSGNDNEEDSAEASRPRRAKRVAPSPSVVVPAAAAKAGGRRRSPRAK